MGNACQIRAAKMRLSNSVDRHNVEGKVPSSTRSHVFRKRYHCISQPTPHLPWQATDGNESVGIGPKG